MIRFHLRLLALSLIFGAMLASDAFAGNDFMQASLRYDLQAVQTSNDYKVSLYNVSIPPSTTYGQYTTAWLGFFFASCPPDPAPYQCQFSQIGFWSNAQGTRWFVYAEPGVTCLRGTQPDSRSCLGNFGDIVSVGGWRIFEMVHYYWQDNFWIARVYDQNTVGYDVARINSNSTAIYQAWSNSEEVYSNDPDPYLTVQYWHYHPEYIVWGTGFQMWPASDSQGQNTIQMLPEAICPNHYGDYTLAWDPRFWYAGSSGTTCSGILF